MRGGAAGGGGGKRGADDGIAGWAARGVVRCGEVVDAAAGRPLSAARVAVGRGGWAAAAA
jgi:hypothetical protein